MPRREHAGRGNGQHERAAHVRSKKGREWIRLCHKARQERAKETFRRLTDHRLEELAAGLGMHRSRLSHLRSDEQDPIQFLDRLIIEAAAKGQNRTVLELLPIHFQETIALACRGEVHSPCLLRLIADVQEVDAADDVSKAMALASGLETEDLERLGRDLRSSITALKQLLIRVVHELHDRRVAA